MVLRFPGMGMPIAVSSAGRRRPIFAENIKKMSPSANGEAAAPRSGGIEAVQRATMGAIADHGQGVEGDTDAPARETTEFGDLFVETSVTLPSGKGVCLSPVESHRDSVIDLRGTNVIVDCVLQNRSEV